MAHARYAALEQGIVARRQLLDTNQRAQARDVLEQIDGGGIETVRLAFADQHGVLRGKTIVASETGAVFANGMQIVSTLLLKDTSHRTVFPVWSEDIGFGHGTLTGSGDLLLVPDPATFRTLPWSPHSGWLLCNVYFKDGSPLPFCSRSVLQRTVASLDLAGFDFVCGLEVEFYVFKVDNPRLEHADGGMPARAPDTSLLSHGYQYLTESRYDALESVMDEIRRACQVVDLPVRSMEAEFGPSQCEFTFKPDGPLIQADRMLLFRSLVKQLCSRRGLHATFMCRPRVDNVLPSGWHLHQSVYDKRTHSNLFAPDNPEALTATASGWIAGVLAHAEESCVLTTPTVNGYKRYQPFQLAPDRIQWGYDNKGAMIRALIEAGDQASRIENRVAEPAANPYLYISSQILSGLDGVERGLSAPAPVETPYAGESPDNALPVSLLAAIEGFENSDFYRARLGADFVSYLSRIKRAEWQRYLMTVSEWEQREYFSIF